MPVLECLCGLLSTRRSFCRAGDDIQERKFRDRVSIAGSKISQKLIHRMVIFVLSPSMLELEPGTPPFDSGRAEIVGNDPKFSGGRDFTHSGLLFGVGVCDM
jgi:hypothetical protein